MNRYRRSQPRPASEIVQLSKSEFTRICGMSFIVGWDKRQLSRVGPPFWGFHWWAGARIRSLVPPYLSDDQKVSSKPLLQSGTISSRGG